MTGVIPRTLRRPFFRHDEEVIPDGESSRRGSDPRNGERPRQGSDPMNGERPSSRAGDGEPSR